MAVIVNPRLDEIRKRLAVDGDSFCGHLPGGDDICVDLAVHGQGDTGNCISAVLGESQPTCGHNPHPGIGRNGGRISQGPPDGKALFVQSQFIIPALCPDDLLRSVLHGLGKALISPLNALLCRAFHGITRVLWGVTVHRRGQTAVQVDFLLHNTHVQPLAGITLHLDNVSHFNRRVAAPFYIAGLKRYFHLRLNQVRNGLVHVWVC